MEKVAYFPAMSLKKFRGASQYKERDTYCMPHRRWLKIQAAIFEENTSVSSSILKNDKESPMRCHTKAQIDI